MDHPLPDAAPLGRRLGALLVDWVVAALTAVVLTPVSYPPDTPLQNLVITAFFVVEVGLLVGLLGVSIGKRLFRLGVMRPDGQPPGIGPALLRTAMICLIVPPMVTNAEGRGLHDVLAGTREVHARPGA